MGKDLCPAALNGATPYWKKCDLDEIATNMWTYWCRQQRLVCVAFKNK